MELADVLSQNSDARLVVYNDIRILYTKNSYTAVDTISLPYIMQYTVLYSA